MHAASLRHDAAQVVFRHSCRRVDPRARRPQLRTFKLLPVPQPVRPLTSSPVCLLIRGGVLRRHSDHRGDMRCFGLGRSVLELGVRPNIYTSFHLNTYQLFSL